jgi:hypothetical protein
MVSIAVIKLYSPDTLPSDPLYETPSIVTPVASLLASMHAVRVKELMIIIRHANLALKAMGFTFLFLFGDRFNEV